MPRVPALPHQLSEVYIDESSQTKHRYLGIGGIIIEQLDVPAFDAAFAKARLPELPNDELKWNKVSRTKLLNRPGFAGGSTL